MSPARSRDSTKAVEIDDSGLLRAHLNVLSEQVRDAVGRRRSVDENPDDPFRGLYVTDDDVDRLLADEQPPIALSGTLSARRQALGAIPGESRLGRLIERFGLSDVDFDLLLVALAPDLDARFEKLYGYLNDDVTRRRATIGLALELAGEPAAAASGRSRLDPSAPLVVGGLVITEELDRPFLTRSLRVPDRVVAHLLGDDAVTPELTPLLTEAPPPVDLDAKPLAEAIVAGSRFVYVRERPGTAARLLACSAVELAGECILLLDLTRLEQDPHPAELACAIEREARLVGAGVVAGPLEALGEGHAARAMLRALAETDCTMILIGRQNWDPQATPRVPLLLDAPLVLPDVSLRAWIDAFEQDGTEPALVKEATAALLLAPEQVARAARSARQQAALEGLAIDAAHVRFGALAQNAAGLERLARRIEPAVSFDDLILTPITLRMLGELVGRVRDRDQVLGSWRMRPGSGRGRGVTALFAGESGTGKTMAAEVIAHELGIDLYTINLATVVDKYVGETEKNLERIFSEAAGVNGVLLFDEADALFGKRSEVKDAHDRYANIEVAYLLQRIESFDGLAVLSTNLRANVDEAFTRRFDAVIDFPFPDVAERRVLWERCLGAKLPRADDVDLDFLAKSFELSGGNIRSIALTAAYLAASSGVRLTMADLVRAVNREYRKLGRLSVRAEFGAWYDIVAEETGTGWDDQKH